MNYVLIKPEELLKEVWKDFNNLNSRTTATNYCCSSADYYPVNNLRQIPIRVQQKLRKKSSNHKNQQL